MERIARKLDNAKQNKNQTGKTNKHCNKPLSSSLSASAPSINPPLWRRDRSAAGDTPFTEFWNKYFILRIRIQMEEPNNSQN